MSLGRFLTFIVLLVLGSRFSLAQYGEHSRYFPQVAAGQGWKSTVKLFNLDGKAGAITIKFRDDAGNPLSFSTSKGLGSTFTLQVAPLMSDTIDLYSEGQLKAGSVEVTSEINFDGYLDLKQCEDCLATVMFSPSGLSFSVELNPNNGLAIFNPSQKEANIAIRAWSDSGTEITNSSTSSLKIPSGGHLAQFFNQDKFQLGDQTGVVIVSSDVPISAVSLKFNGLKFAPVPVMPSPRRVDIPAANKKIGVFYFVPPDRLPQQDVALRVNEGFRLLQKFLDEEMPRNGFRPLQIPVDRDENGLPRVITVQAKNPSAVYQRPNGYNIDLGSIYQEIRPFVPSDWTIPVTFSETYQFAVNDDNTTSIKWLLDAGGPNSDGITATALSGSVHLSAFHLPFMRSDRFGDTRTHAGTPIPIPGFENLGMPLLSAYGDTFEQIDDSALKTFAHELGHALGIYPHTSTGWAKYPTLMGGACGSCGFFRDTGLGKGILLPIEAKILSVSPNLNRTDYGWIQEDETPPEIQFVSKDLINGNLHIVFSASDQESSISAIAITGAGNGWGVGATAVRFYKEITSRDQGNIDLLIPWSDNKPADINLWVFNAKGGFTRLNLF